MATTFDCSRTGPAGDHSHAVVVVTVKAGGVAHEGHEPLSGRVLSSSRTGRGQDAMCGAARWTRAQNHGSGAQPDLQRRPSPQGSHVRVRDGTRYAG